MRSTYNKRFFILLFLLAIFFSAGGFYTFARYQSRGTSNAELHIASWSIKVNTVDITPNTLTSFNTNVLWNNSSYVKTGYIAPGMTGKANIIIDPSGSEVAVNYYILVNSSSINNDHFKVNSISIGGSCSNVVYTDETSCVQNSNVWMPNNLNVIEEGYCSNDQYTTETSCEENSYEWTSNNYPGYYTGEILLPLSGTMTTNEIVNAYINIEWEDLNTATSNIEDTTTGVTYGQTVQNLEVLVIVEQKVS